MNLDETFGLTEDMPLVAMNPLLLLSCVAVAVLAGWFCVRKYRNTYEIEKCIRLYIPFALGGAVLFTLAGLPALFSGGRLLISNYNDTNMTENMGLRPWEAFAILREE